MSAHCHSCGSDLTGREDENTCRGCGKLTCYVCVEAFEHQLDKQHGSGDPSEWLSDLIGERDQLRDDRNGLLRALRAVVEEHDMEGFVCLSWVTLSHARSTVTRIEALDPNILDAIDREDANRAQREREDARTTPRRRATQ